MSSPGRSGQKGEYFWLEADELPDLRGTLVRHHSGDRLCVTSFDSGPFHPGFSARLSGWSTRGELAVSPPISPGFEVPSAGYDEWYLFERPPEEPFSVELFAKCVPFTITPEDCDEEWMLDAQRRLWLQIERTKPISFVIRAHFDIVISRRQEFIAELVRTSGARAPW
jgi:hypothetical protein